MDLLISEEMLLLALDDEKGGTTWLEGWAALSGGVLADAVLAGAVTVHDGGLVPGAEPAHPLLQRVRAAVGAHGEPRTMEDWIHQLPQEVTPFLGTVAERLLSAGVLAEEHGRILGLFPTTRYPEVDPTPERALRERLRRAVVDGAEPAGHDGLLIALVQPAGLVEGLVADGDREVKHTARRRARDIAEQVTAHPQTAAASAAVAVDAAAAAAAMVAVLAAVTTTTVLPVGGSDS